jgi:uncharacterized phage protein gp47/JayE
MSGSFNRPSLQTLYSQAIAAFSAVPGIFPLRRRSRVVIESKLLAGQTDQMYGYMGRLIDWVLIPFTARGNYLTRWMAGAGVPRKLAAPAGGNVIITGPAGTPVGAGWVLKNADTGVLYLTQATLQLTGGGADAAAVVATSGGAAGNLAAGTILSPVTAIAGVSAMVTVGADGLTGGLDVESDTSGQARLRARLSNPPMGGTAADYRSWAMDVAGVTRAWVYPLNRGPGTVDVAFMMDGRTDPFPLPADIATVQAEIDANRPVTADSKVFALTPYLVPVRILNLVPLGGTTVATAQANIAAALAAFFSSTTPTATYGDGIAYGTTGGTIALEQISTAIATAAGVGTFDLATPAVDIVTPAGQLAQLGPLTWV